MKELFLFLLIFICFFSKDGFNQNIDKLFYFKIIIICSVYSILNNIDRKETLEIKYNNSENTELSNKSSTVSPSKDLLESFI